MSSSIDKGDVVMMSKPTFKSSTSFISDAGKDVSQYHTPLPECLQSYSTEDFTRLRKQLVRKIDTRMLPILILLFLLNILDRNNFTNARLGGLEADLGLTDFQYQTALMIMYVGYLLFQFPSNVILSKLKRPGMYLACFCMLWGAVSTCMAATQSWGQVLAVRFFLGFVEAPFFPGALLMLTSWYTREELPLRIAILYSGNTLSNCFGGLVAAGVIGNMNNAAGIRNWRWLFIIEGAITMGMAVVAYFTLPDYPGESSWVNEEERAYAIWRISEEAAGQDDGDDGKSIWAGALEALKDVKVYMLALIQLSLLVGMSFTYFFPSIVKTLGYNSVITLLLTAPPYLLAFFGALGNSLHAGKKNERAFHIMVPLSISCIGNILCISITNSAGRYVAMFLMTFGVYSAFNVTLSWVSSTIPRPKSKRAAALAMVNSVANCTHLFSSYLFPTKDSPRYIPAGITLSCFCGICAFTAFMLRLYLKRQNKKLDRAEGIDSAVDSEESSNDGVVRRTGFRYLL